MAREANWRSVVVDQARRNECLRMKREGSKGNPEIKSEDLGHQ